MFGYTQVNKEDLSDEDKTRYMKVYCGLCKALSKNYGRIGASLLSYDLTLLNLILEDLYNEPQETLTGRCHIHPVKLEYGHTKFSEYASHMQILLSLFALKDKEKDEGKKTISLSILEKREEEIKNNYPRQYRAVSECIAKLDELEKQNCQDPLLMSQISSELLSEVFVPYDDIFAGDLSRLGRSIGRYIYLIDAYDDLEKDMKAGQYNPFMTMKDDENFREEVRELLRDCASEAAQIIEKLPLDENLPILRNIIYSGIWTKFEKKGSKEDKESKKAEEAEESK